MWHVSLLCMQTTKGIVRELQQLEEPKYFGRDTVAIIEAVSSSSEEEIEEVETVKRKHKKRQEKGWHFVEHSRKVSIQHQTEDAELHKIVGVSLDGKMFQHTDSQHQAEGERRPTVYHSHASLETVSVESEAPKEKKIDMKARFQTGMLNVVTFFRSDMVLGREVEVGNKGRKVETRRRSKLPWWCLVFPWFLALLTAVTCCFFA